ncbi:MAG: MlaD family protein [Beijerinckiaceae bacterium]|nr:MlaD family protein [Beijerinckiaceae bacterium]
METRANYALIGAFTLAVVAAAFGFVMWVSGGEKPGNQATYKVVFTGSVSGLSVGGVVLFNGVRVGEVSKIDLMAQDPSHVYALIVIDAKVPVHTDTKARLEYTGLTGVASVALTGGATETPPLRTSAKELGVIYAEPSEFQDLVATARRVAIQASEFFTKSNRLIDENSASISAAVKNVEKVSAAISVKSEDIKMIVTEFEQLSVKLGKAADSLNNFLEAGTSRGPLGEIAAAAKSIKKAADNFNSQIKVIAENINRFAGSGLRQYEALAVDGRKTLDEINQAVRSLESNPQQLLFGKSPQIPQYSGGR